MSETIAVIMSTYNGEQYIAEQIDSILAQKDVQVELYIRDDGSKDSTINIINGYLEKYSNVHLDVGQNIGYVKSFLYELRKIHGFKYYSFSDQDDFWKPEKLSSGINGIQNFNNVPSVYYCNLAVADANLNVYRTTHLESRVKSLQSVALRRSIAGCTIVLNDSLKQLVDNIQLEKIRPTVAHDGMIISLAYAVGGTVVCDSIPHILYRQHGDNTSGSTQGLIGRIKKEKSYFKSLRDNEQWMASYFIQNYHQYIPEEQRRVLKTIATDKKSLVSRITILFDKNYRTGNAYLTFQGKIRGLLGVL